MKILLVDDERTEREGIRFLIEKFQFELEVAEAANGKLAMEYLQKYVLYSLLSLHSPSFMQVFKTELKEYPNL